MGSLLQITFNLKSIYMPNFKILIFIHHLLYYLLWKKLKFSGIIFHKIFDKPKKNKSLHFSSSSSIIIVFPAKHLDWIHIPHGTVIKIVTIYNSELEQWTETLDWSYRYVNFNYFPSLSLNSTISKGKGQVKWSP